MQFPQTINVLVDMRHKNQFGEAVVTQNDTGAEFLVSVVGDKGQSNLPPDAVYILTSLHMRRRPSQKLGVLQPDGNVLFQLGSDELSGTGTVQAHVQAYHPQEGRITSPRFIYHVAPDPLSGETIKPEDRTLIEVVLGEGPILLEETRLEIERAVEERNRLTGALSSLADDKAQALLEMSQSKATADQSAQTAQEAADNADSERERLITDVATKITEVEATRVATVEATEEATGAAEIARTEAEEARLQKEEVADILGAGPVASVNGKTGVIEGLATQDSVDQVATQLAETAMLNSQFDFVEFVENNVGDYDRMVLKKENSSNYFHIIFVKGNKHLTYQFRTSTDDYIVQGDIFAGGLTLVEAMKDKRDAETRTGTWNTNTAPSYFATAPGATFTIDITGEKIDFMHYADTRGGMWEFVIDGNTEKPVLVSTYSTTTGTKTTRLAEGLNNIKHRIVATFKGDDPNNVPSTGAGTARGWVFFNPTATTQGTLIAYAFLNNNSKDKVISPTSNKEFAFQMRKQGIGEYQFVPVHSGTPGVIAIEPAKIMVDGAVLDINTMLNGDEVLVNDFKVIQRVFARNDSAAENLAEITTITSISKNGTVYVSGKMIPLTTIEISDGYGLMLPVNHAFGKRFITGIYNSYPSTLAGGERTNLVTENDKVASGAFLSDSEPNFILACRFDDLKRSLRQGKSGKYPRELTYWIHHRSDFQKLYNSAFRNATLGTSDIFAWKGAYIAAEIPSVNYSI